MNVRGRVISGGLTSATYLSIRRRPLCVSEDRPKRFTDLKDGKVKLDGDNVVDFHKLPESQQVILKVLRWEKRDKRLVINTLITVPEI